MTNAITNYVCPGHIDFVKNFANKKMAEKRADHFVKEYLKREDVETASALILKRADQTNIFKKVYAFVFNKYALEMKYFHKVGACPDQPKVPEIQIVKGVKV